MSGNTKRILIGSALIVGILIIIVCLSRPWKRCKQGCPVKSKKKVTVDESKNIIIPHPEEQEEALSSPSSEEEEQETPPSKDEIIRSGENAHRVELMRGSSAVTRGRTVAPTTAALMMGSLDTRTHGSQGDRASTAVMERMTGRSMEQSESTQSASDPIPFTSVGPHVSSA